MRQTLWEKQYWKGADEEADQKLTFEEVEKLCKRLNISSSKDDLARLFRVRFSFLLGDCILNLLGFFSKRTRRNADIWNSTTFASS